MAGKQREIVYPEEGEIVICTVERINPHSLEVLIDDYGVRGMVHVSEISTRWVKDIRKHAKVGEKKVAVVREVDPRRNTVVLSIKRVKPTQKREKILEYKNEKKAQNLFRIAAQELGKSEEEGLEIYRKIKFSEGLVYPLLEEAAESGDKKELEKAGVPKEWIDKVLELAQKNIKPKRVAIKQKIEVKCLAPDGIEIIKKALLEAAKKGVKIKYLSAPLYQVQAEGEEYLDCQKRVDEAIATIEKSIPKSCGSVVVVAGGKTKE